VHGSSQQIHLPARGERTTFFQTLKASRQVSLDRGSRAGPAGSQATPTVAPDPHSSIAATTHVISSAIVVEQSEEGHAFGVQRPVYFVSEVLSESKVRFPVVQKLLYGILITSRKLRHYFEEYQITVITDYPLADILHNQDATGRISK
jgi:hypothetical protein